MALRATPANQRSPPRILVCRHATQLAPGPKQQSNTRRLDRLHDAVTGATGVEAGQKLGGPSLLFDPGVFSVPDAGTLGNVGRNTLISYCCLWLTTALHGPHELQSNRRERFRS